jgi:asparaginyl-tRNA synthetase
MLTCGIRHTTQTDSAENSNTARHLAEFWMIEPEIAFATLEDDMALAEAYIKATTRCGLLGCHARPDVFACICFLHDVFVAW